MTAPASLGTIPLAMALGSALFYGAADFAGGMAARRASGLAAAAGAQAVGLVLVLALALLGPDRQVTQADLIWGAVSGLSGGTGLMVFFAALADGRMSTVAPISAVISAAIPVSVGLTLGERPSTIAVAGILTAGAAIVLVSREDAQLHGADAHDAGGAPSSARTPTKVLVRAALAGVLFGGFFASLSRASGAAGLWPLVANRALSTVILGSILLLGPASRREGITARQYQWSILGSGVLDVTANALFFLAVARGMLSLVAPLGSLYPASTVLLAVVVLKERLGRGQRIGLVLAGASLLLIGA